MAFVPRVYSASEPSPPLSALPYPLAQEYVKQDYLDPAASSRYFDPRGSPRRPVDAGRPSVTEPLLAPHTCPSVVMGGFRRDSSDNASGSERGPYSSQNHIYVPPSGGLAMTGSHAINGMSNAATYTMYGPYVPPTHPPPNQLSTAQSSDVSMHRGISLVEPQPRNDLRAVQGQPLRTIISTNQSHIPPVPSSDSPSPVSSLSLSSHGSEHSPPLYQKHNFTIPPANDVTYTVPGPPQPTQLQTPATEHYHSPHLIVSEAMYTSWQHSLSDTRRMSAAHGEGVGFVL